MKKIFFLFALLASRAASGQNMQITTLSATYTTSPMIAFKVSWTGAREYRHNTKVWVFVDYRKIENNVPASSWTRAAVTAPPAVNSTPTSTTATLVPNNDKGFWLHGVDGDYSATITATLSGVPAQFSWCAYATDYPPNVVIHGASSYTLRGSPPFVINGATLPASQSTYNDTITSFTDATGAPGRFPAPLNEPPNEMGCIAGLVEDPSGVCVEPSTVGCVNNTLDLGVVSFTAGTEVEIVGNGISQRWSRPVTATGCQKETYNYGNAYDVKSDCRTNPSYKSDLFNACAVIRYAENICPYPWRVPSADDARKLITAMGSNYEYGYDQEFVENKMLGIWGGELSGSCCLFDDKEWQDYYVEYATQSVRNNSELAGTYRDVIICIARAQCPTCEGNWFSPWFYGVSHSWMHRLRPVRCVRD
jgi:hypothetical protein